MSSLSSFSRKETIFMRKTFFKATFQNQVIILQKHLTIHHYLKNIPHFHVPPNLWSICWQLHLCTLLPRIFITLTPCCHHCFLLLFRTWGLIWLRFFSLNLLKLNILHELLWEEIKVFVFTFFLFIINYWSFEWYIISFFYFNLLMLVHVHRMSHEWPNELFKWDLWKIIGFLNDNHLNFLFLWDFKIFMTFSIMPKAWNLFTIFMNLVNIIVIVKLNKNKDYYD